MSDSRLEQVIQQIAASLNQIAKDKGVLLPPIGPDSPLLGGELPVDSLDLAVLVVDLEEKLKMDPFKEGFIHFRTVGELAALYR